MNLYQAFGGNPVNFVDPWGMENYGCNMNKGTCIRTSPHKCGKEEKSVAWKGFKPSVSSKRKRRPYYSPKYGVFIEGPDKTAAFVKHFTLGLAKALPFAALIYFAPTVGIGVVIALTAYNFANYGVKGMVPQTEEEAVEMAAGWLLLTGALKKGPARIGWWGKAGRKKHWKKADECAKYYNNFIAYCKKEGITYARYHPPIGNYSGHGCVRFWHRGKQWIYDPTLGDNLGLIYGKSPVPRSGWFGEFFVTFTPEEHAAILRKTARMKKAVDKIQPSNIVVPPVKSPSRPSSSSGKSSSYDQWNAKGRGRITNSNRQGRLKK